MVQVGQRLWGKWRRDALEELIQKEEWRLVDYRATITKAWERNLHDPPPRSSSDPSGKITTLRVGPLNDADWASPKGHTARSYVEGLLEDRNMPLVTMDPPPTLYLQIPESFYESFMGPKLISRIRDGEYYNRTAWLAEVITRAERAGPIPTGYIHEEYAVSCTEALTSEQQVRLRLAALTLGTSIKDIFMRGVYAEAN